MYLNKISAWGLLDTTLKFDPRLPGQQAGNKQTILELLPENTTRHMEMIIEKIEAIRELLNQ